MKKIGGFTLIELLIVLAVVVILGVIAVSVYSTSILKGRRADAINALLNIALAEEKYRTTNTTYGTLANMGQSSTTPQGYYTLTTSSVTATTYTVTATAVGQQANDMEGSTACSTISLIMSAGTVSKTPAACWPT